MNFIYFINNPSYFKKERTTSINVIYSFLFFLFSSYLFSLVIYFIFRYLNLNFKSGILEIFKNDLLKVVIIAPFLEEFLFRAILKPNKLYLSFFLFATSLFSFNLFSFNTYVVIFLSFFISISFFFSKIEMNYKKYNNNYKKLVYGSSILFGLVHLTNYDVTLHLLLFYLILTLPKIYLGFSLAFIRVKFGLIYAILFHSLHNALPFLLKYFF